jgi:hypothetical protein
MTQSSLCATSRYAEPASRPWEKHLLELQGTTMGTQPVWICQIHIMHCSANTIIAVCNNTDTRSPAVRHQMPILLLLLPVYLGKDGSPSHAPVIARRGISGRRGTVTVTAPSSTSTQGHRRWVGWQITRMQANM